MSEEGCGEWPDREKSKPGLKTKCPVQNALDLVPPVICYADYFSVTSLKNGRLKKSVSQGFMRI